MVATCFYDLQRIYWPVPIVQDAMMATGMFLHLAQLCIKIYEQLYIYILRRFIEIGLIETNLPEIRLILNSSIEIRSIDNDTDQFTSV